LRRIARNETRKKARRGGGKAKHTGQETAGPWEKEVGIVIAGEEGGEGKAAGRKVTAKISQREKKQKLKREKRLNSTAI